MNKTGNLQIEFNFYKCSFNLKDKIEATGNTVHTVHPQPTWYRCMYCTYLRTYNREVVIFLLRVQAIEAKLKSSASIACTLREAAVCGRNVNDVLL